MAAVTKLGTETWNTTSGTKTVVATPAVNDLIVIVFGHSGSTADPGLSDSAGGTYTIIEDELTDTGASRFGIAIRTALISSASSTTFTTAPGATTGGGLTVLKVTGMSRVGAAAARQAGREAFKAAATPTVPMDVGAILTANAVVGAVYDQSNPAALTPPGSWTERADVGYASPARGLEVATRDSGETGSTITWGGAAPSSYAAVVVELDTSPPTIAYTQAQETDSALGTAARLGYGLASVANSALGFGARLGYGVAIEADSAQGFTLAGGGFAYTAAIETDTARSVDARLGYGVASTTNTALGFAARLGIGVALEADSARGIGARLGFGLVLEADTARAVAARLGYGLALETDTALGFAGPTTVGYLVAIEVDSAGTFLAVVGAGPHIITHLGDEPAGAPTGLLIVSHEGDVPAGVGAGAALIVSHEGAAPGGAPAGTALIVSHEGDAPAGAPSGPVHVVGRRGA